MNQKAPIFRTCVITREKHLKSELFRLVKVNGQIVYDKDQALGGRGVYITKDKSVIDLAKKSKVLNKAFRTSEISEQVYLDLYRELN